MWKLGKRKGPEEAFWAWFARNENDLFSFERDREKIFDRLQKALHSVHADLTFEFGPVLEDGRREFIVSADGLKAGFPAVRQVVAAAPQFERWIVVAFRPPKDIDYSIELGDVKLGPDDVWFEAEPDREKVGLRLYIRGLTDPGDQRFALASFLLLDNALGEYAVETQVGFVERLPLPENPTAHGLRPFRDITSVVERHLH